MSGECHFCHGLVSGYERDHIVLDGHADHEVYVHERCAAGNGLVEKTAGPGDDVAVTCPECGETERH